MDQFAAQLLRWFQQHGRCNLPWQTKRTYYRVWVSEIMLQQTQVTTVIPYYKRFIKAFPTVARLAAADIDNVLHHWTGLGYYARARNLHKAAGIIVSRYRGRFPKDITALMSLPGIGRSTAAAILALTAAERHAILDGNVKRVLSRYHGVAGWPGKSAVLKRLWSYAEQHTPVAAVADYTQAIMDLGATICVRRQPVCNHCPVSKDCYARISAQQHLFPEAKPKTKLPQRKTIFAIIENSNGELLLERRPPSGIWGGLWCFPELPTNRPIHQLVKKQYRCNMKDKIEYKSFKHTFTHFQLLIKPIRIKLEGDSSLVQPTATVIWLRKDKPVNLGFPTPVVSLLKLLQFNYPKRAAI